MTRHKIDNIRIGEILLRDFLIPRNISVAQLAKGTGLSTEDLHKILQGEMSISATTAEALGHFFGNSAEFWMNECAISPVENGVYKKGKMTQFPGRRKTEVNCKG